MHQPVKALVIDVGQAKSCGENPAHMADGVLPASIAPSKMGFSDESIDARRMEPVKTDEPRPVVRRSSFVSIE